MLQNFTPYVDDVQRSHARRLRGPHEAEEGQRGHQEEAEREEEGGEEDEKRKG